MKRQRLRIRKDNKIDDSELVRLLIAERWSQARIADHFRVRPPAITQRLRLLGFTRKTLVGASEMTGTTHEAHIESAFAGGLDVATRLQEIDAALVEELTFLRTRGGISEDKREQLTEKLLATLGELRKTSGTWIELSRAMASIAEISMFREIVLQALNEESPALKQRVLARLAQARSGHRMLTPMLPAGESA